LAPVANLFCADAGEPLAVLVIDSERLSSPSQYDDVPGSDEPFPHIYGPLNPDAVVAVVPLEAGPDGTFAFDPRLPPRRRADSASPLRT
jgi:uncharacterized protein (DUF952 family)